jgi:hypothetical protein
MVLFWHLSHSCQALTGGAMNIHIGNWPSQFTPAATAFPRLTLHKVIQRLAGCRDSPANVAYLFAPASYET